MKWLWAVALLVEGVSGLYAADLKAAITPPVERFLTDRKNAGLVVGIRQNGASTVLGFGTVHLPGGEQTPNGDTIFELGSITKGFTGILLAEAIRRGEVKLDTPAQNFMPPDLVLPRIVEDKPITLEHLATHRSGLIVQPPLITLTAKNFENPYADYDRVKLAAMLKKLTPTLKPGEKFLYSNLGAGLVGHALVHSAKAERFNDLLQARICKPLGLKNTTEALDGAQRSRYARAHKSDGTPTSHWDFASLEACGGIRSCMNDMLAFASEALGDSKDDLFPPLASAFRPRKKMNEDTSICLFWMRSERPGRPVMIWHNGSTYGHRCILLIVPETKTAVVVMSAIATVDVDKLGLDILDLLNPPKQ